MKHHAKLLPVVGVVFIDLLGFGIVIPLIALYGQHYNASALELAVLGCAYSFFQFLFAPVWGSLSDRLGRKPILLVSLCGSTSSYLLFALAGSYPTLLLSRALAGIFAANISTAQAYAADVTDKQNRAKAMGLIGAAIGLGFTLGPPLGGVAVKHLGLSAPGYIAAAICALNLLACILFLPESRRGDTAAVPQDSAALAATGSLPRNRPLLTLIVIYAVAIFAFSHMEQTFSLFLKHEFSLSTEDAGYRAGLLMLAMGVAGVITQGALIRPLLKRWGEWRIFLTGLLISTAGMLFFSRVSQIAPMYAAGVIAALGSALVQPTVSALISKLGGSDEQGRTFGTAHSLGALARVVGPFSGLYAYSLYPHAPFVIAALLFLAAFIAAFMLHRAEQTRVVCAAEARPAG